MLLTNAIARHYFSPPSGYFWHWSEGSDVLEWYDGSTLCFRSDLENILRGMTEANQPLPPLGTILLVIAACQDSWKNISRIKEILIHIPPKRSDSMNDSYIEMVAKMLHVVGELPRELRSGQNRAQLLRELMVSASGNQLKPDVAKELVAAFTSGQVDTVIQTSNPNRDKLSRLEIMRLAREARLKRVDQGGLLQGFIQKLSVEAPKRFMQETLPFVSAWNAFHKDGTLEHKLRTGLGLPLQPMPLELPEPEPPANDLLDELARDPETAGIARLTRRLVAAFHIPRHAVGASDLPLGGVADITNRGDFDRLLLSELAQDDLLLMARLANNEAMFLRREEPPAQPERARILLIDTSLKMWGTPRPFAMATALACALQTAKEKVETRAFLLGDYGYHPADLDNKDGVINALEHLDPALHCAGGLTDFFNENPPSEDEDCFFISDAEAIQNADFQKCFAEIKNRLRFLILLKRDGGLDFFELVNGHRKLLSSARLDLGELLFGMKKKQPQKLPPPYPEEHLPKFFGQVHSPLRYPMTSSRLRPKNVMWGEVYNAVVTDQNRVLLWDSFQQGAEEMVACLPSSDYCLGENQSRNICVLVRDPNDNRLQLLEAVPYMPNKLKTHTWPLVFRGHLRMIYDFGKFYIFHEGKVYSIDDSDYSLTEHFDMEGFISVHFDRNKFNLVKRMANPGYSTLQHAKHIFVTPSGKLILDNYALRVTADRWRVSKIWKRNNHDKASRTEVFTMPSNPKLRLYRRIWKQGGEIIVDGRGLLHLRSANPEIPEVCLTLNLQKGIGMWASDGACAGNPYFLHSRLVDFARYDFYERYIQPILQGFSD